MTTRQLLEQGWLASETADSAREAIIMQGLKYQLRDKIAQDNVEQCKSVIDAIKASRKEILKSREDNREGFETLGTIGPLDPIESRISQLMSRSSSKSTGPIHQRDNIWTFGEIPAKKVGNVFIFPCGSRLNADNLKSLTNEDPRNFTRNEADNLRNVFFMRVYTQAKGFQKE